jgi:dTDP-4-dehydrorhamnose reductase
VRRGFLAHGGPTAGADVRSRGPVLLTGGSGRLGIELRQLLAGVVAPPRSEMEITDAVSVKQSLNRYHPGLVIHAAAFTDVARAEQERDVCWRTNVHGTRNVARAVATSGGFLVHISTDYVFAGTRGMYREDDTPGPVRNYYALSKLVAEEAARSATRHLIIRTSFRPRQWPHAVAFTDVYTSQDYVDVIAPKIALAIRHLSDIPYEILHIASERKSTFDLARRRRPGVEPRSKNEAPVALPDDISLDTSRWEGLKQQWRDRQWNVDDVPEDDRG